MRPFRVTLALAAASTLLLAGCTDPSPDPDPTTADASSSEAGPTESGSEPSDDATSATEVGTEPPVVGGAGSVCVNAVDAAGSELTVSTMVTATDAITIRSMTLDPASPDLEILDEYVLPPGQSGLTLGDYPPIDAGADRADAAGYELDAGESVTVGVGFAIDDDAVEVDGALTLGYTDAAGADHTLTTGYDFAVREQCGD